MVAPALLRNWCVAIRPTETLGFLTRSIWENNTLSLYWFIDELTVEGKESEMIARFNEFIRSTDFKAVKSDWQKYVLKKDGVTITLTTGFTADGYIDDIEWKVEIEAPAIPDYDDLYKHFPHLKN